MSQADLGTIDGTPGTGTPGSDLATLLNAWRSAVHSGHAGSSRPAYAVASMTWVKTVSSTAHEIYYYDGTDDILLYTVNPTANIADNNITGNVYSNSGNGPLNPVGSPPDGLSWTRGSSQLILSKTGGAVLTIVRHGSDGAIMPFYRNNVLVGGISITTTATSYATSSDYRLKYEIEPVVTFDMPALDGPLGKLMRLRPVRYRMHADNGAGLHHGFIAHELQSEVPQAVTGFKDQTEERPVQVGTTEDGTPIMQTQQVPVMQGVDYGQVVSLLTAAVQQLTLKVLELENAHNS